MSLTELRDRTLISGSCAAVASALALAALGKRELGSAATPVNGPSQWVWGRQAPYEDGFSVRHTVVGYAIHHAASFVWAALFEAMRLRARPGLASTIKVAATTTAIGSLVDLQLTPDRLTPGFQKRLSRAALAGVYAAFAAGLAAGAVLHSRRAR